MAAAAPQRALSWWRGLDVVIGYQVSWILMFADYSRYTRSVRGSGIAIFLGLAITSGSLALLHLSNADPSNLLEIGVLVAANLVATIVRFVLLRGWVFRRATVA